MLKEFEEQSFMEGSDDENLPLVTSDRNLQQFDISLNHSGLARKTVCTIDAAVQCEVGDVDAIGWPRICTGARNCTKVIKSTWAEGSVKCNISMECSRIAVKAVCKVSTITHFIWIEMRPLTVTLTWQSSKKSSIGPRKPKLMTKG